MHTVAFRCDADSQIGTGHVMRCLALAEELKNRNFNVVFASKLSGVEWLNSALSTYKVMYPESMNWGSIQTAIVDSYQVNIAELQTIREATSKTVLIADDATPSFAADLYLEPGVNQSFSPPRESRHSLRLSGPSAVLIRSDIRHLRPTDPYSPQGRISSKKNILLTLGSAASQVLIAEVLMILKDLGTSRHIDVVSRRPPSRPLASDITWHAPGFPLAKLLERADLVISAAGVTAWEVLCSGRTLGLIQTVANQEQNYKFMCGEDLIFPLGRVCVGGHLDGGEISSLLVDHDLRVRRRDRALELVDGLGVVRAAEAIIGLYSLRPDADTSK